MNGIVPSCDVTIDWDAVFRQYAPVVRAFVRSRVPAASVDDAVQDTFERAFRSRHRFDTSRPVWPWLVTIAKRTCLEARPRHPTESLVEVQAERALSGSDPHVELERRLQARAISEALAGLTARHRRLLVGWEIEGRPFEQLAAQEGLTRQALKSAICRARNGFRQGYASVAERTGLAAFAIGRLLGRLRDRMHAISPGAEVLIGGVVVGIATAAVLMAAGPIGGSAASPQVAAASGAAATASSGPSLDVPLPTGAGEGEGGGGAVASPAPPSPPSPSAPVGSLVPRAGGDANVTVTPGGSQAGLSLHWREDSVGGAADVSVTVECSGVVSDVACLAIRATPQSD
jgi:RNA polymerase sigma-70 factor (ECF subfamily)